MSNISSSGGSVNIHIVSGANTTDPTKSYFVPTAVGSIYGVAAPTGCFGSSDCPTGYACVNGTCTDVSNTSAGNLVGPGDCDIEEAEGGSEPCNDGDGCVEVGQGDCSSDLDGGLNCCGPTYKGWVVTNIKGDGGLGTTWTETWVEQCEPITGQCDQYADQWFKNTGELPDGYTAEDICSSCEECGTKGGCFPIYFNPPCYCAGENCQNSDGPCYSCDRDTGDCIEDCADCVMNSGGLFTCNCDASETIHQSQCHINPCSGYGADGKSCLDQQIEYREKFCQDNFPCLDESDPCIVSRKTYSKVGSTPPCPVGAVCNGNNLIKNEETGEITYMLTATVYKENCGCSAETGSKYWRPCGSCQSCVNNKCEHDSSKCPTIFYGGGRYEISYGEDTITSYYCTGCTGYDYSENNAIWQRSYCSSGTDTVYLAGITPVDGFDFSVFWREGGPIQGSGTRRSYTSDGIFSYDLQEQTLSVTKSCGNFDGDLKYAQIGTVTYQTKYMITYDDTAADKMQVLVTWNDPIYGASGADSWRGGQPQVRKRRYTKGSTTRTGNAPGGTGSRVSESNFAQYSDFVAWGGYEVLEGPYDNYTPIYDDDGNPLDNSGSY